MACHTKHNILISGPPGIGKTTLVRKVCQELSRRQLTVKGFYTEEVRASGQRIGFDIVNLNGDRAQLARIGGGTSPFCVGKYNVDIPSFEKISIPLLKQEADSNVFVIDEIGKMELFSEQFQSLVNQIFTNKKCRILATIPIAKDKPLPLVESLRNRNDVQLITVSRGNRDELIGTIADLFGSVA